MAKTAKPPPTPMVELFDICARATDGTVWAIGEGKTNTGKPLWYAYGSSKKNSKRLPITYRGRKVVFFLCPKPRILKA